MQLVGYAVFALDELTHHQQRTAQHKQELPQIIAIARRHYMPIPLTLSIGLRRVVTLIGALFRVLVATVLVVRVPAL
jgi:hypothetical protein